MAKKAKKKAEKTEKEYAEWFDKEAGRLGMTGENLLELVCNTSMDLSQAVRLAETERVAVEAAGRMREAGKCMDLSFPQASVRRPILVLEEAAHAELLRFAILEGAGRDLRGQFDIEINDWRVGKDGSVQVYYDWTVKTPRGAALLSRFAAGLARQEGHSPRVGRRRRAAG